MVRGKRRANKNAARPSRAVNYSQLTHPFIPQSVLTEDAVAGVHDAALRVLEELGIKILLPEAREIFVRSGALVDDDTQMVRIGRDLVAAALSTAPRSFTFKGADPVRDQDYALGSLIFAPGGGCPNVTDLIRGRRAGSAETFIETTKLQQSFDVIHILGPSAEPQDIPVHERHLFMMQQQCMLSDKPVSQASRGRAQIQDGFEVLRLARGLDEDAFGENVWAKTIINTNSPRMIDNPMAEGIIDFARAGQLSIITPFCLAGAMAPITVAGALTLQHAETLAGITLAQMTCAGAPVSYGGFSSNVDMKSGSPAFGTPEHVKLMIGTGQMARHVGMPWRGAAGSAGVVADMQSAGENHMALWGAMQANATLILHAAGWLEGGLTFGYEKFINDVEALQVLAELAHPIPQTDDDIGFDAIAAAEPGGHFFDNPHTMSRFQTAFYDPLNADLNNHGGFVAAGARDATMRATDIWQERLRDFKAPTICEPVKDRTQVFIDRRIQEGGATVVG